MQFKVPDDYEWPTNVVNDEPKRKTKKEEEPMGKSSGGLTKWYERKYPVGDNGLPVVDPGVYWLVVEDIADINVGYSGTKTIPITKLVLMDSNKKIRDGFLWMKQRDTKVASIRMIRKQSYSDNIEAVERTPSNMLEFAELLLDKMEAKRKLDEEKARKDGLLGDYRFKALDLEEL